VGGSRAQSKESQQNIYQKGILDDLLEKTFWDEF